MSQKTYYLFNPGRMSRKDNTLRFDPVSEVGNESKPRYIPIEGVSDLYVFGSLDANSELYNFLGRHHIIVHFFDYYEHYRGSFMPKEYLLAGKAQIEQTRTYLNKKRRLYLARQLVHGASYNMLRNLKYYKARGKDLDEIIGSIEGLRKSIGEVYDVSTLMGYEGNMRKSYYQAFGKILSNWEISGRTKQPPKDPVNALISFGNMMCYALCLGQIYHTQLNPTISFLHEPGYRRYSLALDIAEIFKPILVDRVIFKVLNKKMITQKDFDPSTGGILMKDSGKKSFIKAFEDRLNDTIEHRHLKKRVSYKRLVRLECYKMIKYILGIEDQYRPFKIWW